MKMTNRWNTRIYHLWAPLYDRALPRFFRPGREAAMRLLAPAAGEYVLIPGVGTGADLPLLPVGVDVTGIDLSADMLAKAREKVLGCRARVTLVEGDVQTLLVPEESFDAALLNLILSVVPDAHACLAATLRAVKPGGRVVVFDKFQPDGERLSPGRRIMNLFTTAMGTDITRRFGEIAAGCPCTVEIDEPSLLNGMYRVMRLRKTA